MSWWVWVLIGIATPVVLFFVSAVVVGTVQAIVEVARESKAKKRNEQIHDEVPPWGTRESDWN